MMAVRRILALRQATLIGRLFLVVGQRVRLNLVDLVPDPVRLKIGRSLQFVAQLVLRLQTLQSCLQVALLVLKLRHFVQDLILTLKTLKLRLQIALLPLELAQFL